MNKELTVKEVKVFETLTMLVTFSTNEVKIFDVMEIVDKPAFKPLEVIDNFKTARVVDGIVTWLDGKIDLAPGTMHNLSYDYDTENVITGKKAKKAVGAMKFLVSKKSRKNMLKTLV